MKKKYIKLTFELCGLQLFFAVLSMFFVEFFSWIDGWQWIYSAFTGWLFLGAVHSTFWQQGNKDRKNNIIANNHLQEGQPKIKLNIFQGAKFALGFLGINLLVLLLTFLCDNGKTFGNVIFFIHRTLLFPLAGFIPNGGSSYYWPVCILLCLIMYIPCVTAYISGMHNFSLIEKYVPKIIYKSNKKD